MLSSHAGTKFRFEGSFGDFLNLGGNWVAERRVDDDLDVLHRPDDVGQGEEGGLADGGGGQSVARHDDVVGICQAHFHQAC